jgi:hypothetical protein
VSPFAALLTCAVTLALTWRILQAFEARQAMQDSAPPARAPASAPPGANAALSLKMEAPRVVTASTLFGHPLFKKNDDTQHEEASAAAGGPENTTTLSGSQWAKTASVEYDAAAGQYGATTVGGAKSNAPDDGSLVVQKAAEYTRARRTALGARIQQQGQEGHSALQEGVGDQEQLTLGGACVQCMCACASSKCLCGSIIVARPSPSFFPRLCGPPSSPPWTLSTSTLRQRMVEICFLSNRYRAVTWRYVPPTQPW